MSNSDKDKCEAYLICKVRGHTAGGKRYKSGNHNDALVNECKFCGTHYYTALETKEIKRTRPDL